MKIDLHVHSRASDGCYSVRELCTMAIDAGLDAMAITDHDTLDGFWQISNEVNQYPLALLPGVEFSTEVGLFDVHILGYRFDIDNDHLNTVLQDLADDRMVRAQTMVSRLRNMGYHIEFERVLELSAGSVSVGRPHIARALLEKGYVESRREAFDRMLGKQSAAYVPHKKLLPQQVIQLIQQAKGIAVLAHPALIGNNQMVDNLIEIGIQGLEVFHPKHTDNDTRYFLSLAESKGLLITGGSDFHGIEGRYPSFLGEFIMPEHYADKLMLIQA